MLAEMIGPYNAIAHIAMSEVEAALEAGWRVTVVAKWVHEALCRRVEWLKLYVPKRGFALKWLTGRHYIRKALGDSSRFDLIWGHQPQIADLCDVFNSHFLTRAVFERGGFCRPNSMRGLLGWAQQHIVLHAEDRFYQNWNQHTHMVFCSELLRKEFARHYGMPARNEVLVNFAPAFVNVEARDRERAREDVAKVRDSRIVLGYLGGIDPRKGYQELTEALRGENDLFLLIGGANSAGFYDRGLAGRHYSTGLVNDTSQFYKACDVFIVPSRFDPCPLVVLEAAAHGIPVIVTNDVGNAPEVTRFGAGMVWERSAPLAPMVRELHRRRVEYCEGARRMCNALSEERFRARVSVVLNESKRCR